jgi:hypothetical protein
MERRYELKREQDRIKEEQEDEGREAKKWVNRDQTPEEDTLEELYMEIHCQ